MIEAFSFPAGTYGDGVAVASGAGFLNDGDLVAVSVVAAPAAPAATLLHAKNNKHQYWRAFRSIKCPKRPPSRDFGDGL